MITVHREGQARSLDLLTLDDCASVGTALGAIHRLPTAFLSAAKYPVFTTGQIRSQLTAGLSVCARQDMCRRKSPIVGRES